MEENGTGADDGNKMQVDSLKKGNEEGKGKHPKQKCTRTGNTDVNNCKNCGRTGHWVKDCWRPGGGAHDNSNKNQRKGKNNTTEKGKGPRGGRGATSQSSETASTLSCPSQTPRTIQALWCNPDTQQKGWIMTLGGVTMSFTVSNSETSWCRRLAS